MTTSLLRIRKASAAAVVAAIAACLSPAAVAEPAPALRSVVSAQDVSLAGVEVTGCWVKFHDGERQVGDELMLVGPLDLADLTRVGAGWRDWNSAIVGPFAQVEVFAETDFEQPVATLQPRQIVANMVRSVGPYKDIESVRVRCRRP